MSASSQNNCKSREVDLRSHQHIQYQRVILITPGETRSPRTWDNSVTMLNHLMATDVSRSEQVAKSRRANTSSRHLFHDRGRVKGTAKEGTLPKGLQFNKMNALNVNARPTFPKQYTVSSIRHRRYKVWLSLWINKSARRTVTATLDVAARSNLVNHEHLARGGGQGSWMPVYDCGPIEAADWNHRSYSDIHHPADVPVHLC